MNQQGVIGGSTGVTFRFLSGFVSGFLSDLGAPCARLFCAQGSVSGPWALDLRYRPHFSTHFGPNTATLGAGFCDSYTLSILFRILGWDPGRWIRRQLHTFDTFSELNRIGFHRICDTGHIFHTIWIHILDPGLGPWALDLVTVTHFSHIGLWISHIYTSFHTFGPDRIGSDRSGSNSDESLCVDPIVKNPYVWIQ